MITELSLNDEKEVTALIAQAFSAPPWNDDWTDEKLHIYYLDLAGNPNSLVLGYFDDGLCAVALGRLKHWYNGIEYCIDDLGVDPTKQGKGVGSAFLKEIGEYARTHHFKEVTLYTRKSAQAYTFYQKNGWQESADWVQFSLDTGGHDD